MSRHIVETGSLDLVTLSPRHAGSIGSLHLVTLSTPSESPERVTEPSDYLDPVENFLAVEKGSLRGPERVTELSDPTRSNTRRDKYVVQDGYYSLHRVEPLTSSANRTSHDPASSTPERDVVRDVVDDPERTRS